MGTYRNKSLEYMKPPKFKHYFTITELSRAVDRTTNRLLTLEKEGRIPEAQRFEWRGRNIRLWSPAQVDEIKVLISQIKKGRPSANS